VIKTGEVLDRDEEGLWLCESWQDEAGEVTTTRTKIDETVESDG
jgi:hypothetical protein